MSLFKLINKYLFQFISFVFTISILQSCLEERPAQRMSSPSISDSWFTGVNQVRNLGGLPIGIEIKWTPSPTASAYKIYTLAENADSKLIEWTLIETIPQSNANIYIHRDPNFIKSGRVYTYRVRALDLLGIEDTNLEQKNTIAFEGITSVKILTKTSAQVEVLTSGAFSSLRVTAHPTRLPITDTAHDSVKTFNSSIKTIEFEDLKPGTTYSFNAEALTTKNIPDGNDYAIQSQTPSDSYGTGSKEEDLSQFQYRNIRLVQAFGSAPNELNVTSAQEKAPGLTTALNATPTDLTENINPHKRSVIIVPNPFNSTTGTYRVIRAPAIGLSGNEPPSKLDTATFTPCVITKKDDQLIYEEQSCVVCDHTGLSEITSATVTAGTCDLNFDQGIPNFIDKSVAPPKKKYFYTISKVKNYKNLPWPEELPLNNKNDFLFSAHIPDDYMVLIHRESANYEMCHLLNKTSDPKKWNRCEYKGLAATPYTTSGIKRNLDSGFYDFGYNLLADRHALSCNWTGSDQLNLGQGVTVHGGISTTDFKRLVTSSNQPEISNNLIELSSLAEPLPETWKCEKGGVCISLGLSSSVPNILNANLTFNNETLTNNEIVLPNSNQTLANANARWSILPSPEFVPKDYDKNPLTLFNIQNRGNNCYVRYFLKNNILSNTINTTSTALIGANSSQWHTVGSLANLEFQTESLSTSTRDQIRKIVANSVTADPGPLQVVNGVVVTNRKRPTINGLSSSEAQALCASKETSYGKKRTWRRREFIAATPLSYFQGEPGFTTLPQKTDIEFKNQQTLYNRNPTTNSSRTQSFGPGTESLLGRNTGHCSTGTNEYAQISSNPSYEHVATDPVEIDSYSRNRNSTVSVLNSKFCSPTSTNTTCTIKRNTATLFLSPLNTTYSTQNSFYGYNSDHYESFENITYLDTYIKEFLSPLNESTHIEVRGSGGNEGGRVGNGYINPFFIGSLATHKCVSRFGLQDPYLANKAEVGNAFSTEENSASGYIFSDLFSQESTLDKTTNSPVFIPLSNNLDLGVFYDYYYNNVALEFGAGKTFTTGISGANTKSCHHKGIGTQVPTLNSRTFYTNNYYYFNARKNSHLSSTIMNKCISDDTGNNRNSTSIDNSYESLLSYAIDSNTTERALIINSGYTLGSNITVNRNASDFTAGFIPVLGLAISNNTLIDDQTSIDLNTMIYSNQFAASPTGNGAYARYLYSSSGKGKVFMTSGKGGRWSHEISESRIDNSMGAAWCVVEAE